MTISLEIEYKSTNPLTKTHVQNIYHGIEGITTKLKKIITLIFGNDLFFSEEDDEKIIEYSVSDSLIVLIAYMSNTQEKSVSLDFSPSNAIKDKSVKKITYFVKRVASSLSEKSLSCQVLYGTILRNDNGFLDSYITIFRNEIIPRFLSHCRMQDNNSNEKQKGNFRVFSAKARRIFELVINSHLKSLYMVRSKLNDFMELYVPSFSFDVSNLDAIRYDVEIKNELDLYLLYWTQSVKETAGQLTSSRHESVRAEIYYWRKKTQEMTFMAKQLSENNLLTIKELCIKVGTIYSEQFEIATYNVFKKLVEADFLMDGLERLSAPFDTLFKALTLEERVSCYDSMFKCIMAVADSKGEKFLGVSLEKYFLKICIEEVLNFTLSRCNLDRLFDFSKPISIFKMDLMDALGAIAEWKKKALSFVESCSSIDCDIKLFEVDIWAQDLQLVLDFTVFRSQFCFCRENDFNRNCKIDSKDLLSQRLLGIDNRYANILAEIKPFLVRLFGNNRADVRQVLKKKLVFASNLELELITSLYPYCNMDNVYKVVKFINICFPILQTVKMKSWLLTKWQQQVESSKSRLLELQGRIRRGERLSSYIYFLSPETEQVLFLRKSLEFINYEIEALKSIHILYIKYSHEVLTLYQKLSTELKLKISGYKFHMSLTLFDVGSLLYEYNNQIQKLTYLGKPSLPVIKNTIFKLLLVGKERKISYHNSETLEVELLGGNIALSFNLLQKSCFKFFDQFKISCLEQLALKAQAIMYNINAKSELSSLLEQVEYLNNTLRQIDKNINLLIKDIEDIGAIHLPLTSFNKNQSPEQFLTRYDSFFSKQIIIIEEFLRKKENSYTQFQQILGAVENSTQSIINSDILHLRSIVKSELYESVLHSIGNNLQELFVLMTGNIEEGVPAVVLFSLEVQLIEGVLTFKPELVQMTAIVSSLCKQVFDLFQNYELEEHFDFRKNMKLETYESQVLNFFQNIVSTAANHTQELKLRLDYWFKFRVLWEQSLSILCNRFASNKYDANSCYHEINAISKLLDEIETESDSEISQFCIISYKTIKEQLTHMGLNWKNTLKNAFVDRTETEIANAFVMMENAVSNLSKDPKSLEELTTKINLTASLESDSKKIIAIHENVTTFITYFEALELKLNEIYDLKLKKLNNYITSFDDLLQNCKTQVHNRKAQFLNGLENEVSEFERDVKSFVAYNKETLPIDELDDASTGLRHVMKVRTKLQSFENKSARINTDLNVFQQSFALPEQILYVMHELDRLEEIFQLRISWDKIWKEARLTCFSDIELETLERTASSFVKATNKLGRSTLKSQGIIGLKTAQLPCFKRLKQMVDQFRQTLPLLQDLKGPGIRQRHWEQIMKKIDIKFDATSSDFTLEKLFALGLHLHSDFVAEIGANAHKELAIENSLKALIEEWSVLELEFITHKNEYYKLKVNEETIALLEDNMITISTIKASRFFSSFREDVEKWDNILNTINDVIDLFLQVQRQWIYLESIFMAGEDIKRQLPVEAAQFRNVHKKYISTSKSFVENSVASICCMQPCLEETLKHMDVSLESIQKSLEQFLETKRQTFPRFYFLSNDDLLEILGQQNEPRHIEKHLKKCFMGIKGLIYDENESNGLCAATIVSPDGELLELSENLRLVGPVESWLLILEYSMRNCVKKTIQTVLAGLRMQRAKWIKKFQGQLLITVGSISWTLSCAKAIEAVSEGLEKKAIKQVKKRQTSYLKKLSAIVRGNLSSVERKKVVALITMEIHNRDVLDKLIKGKVKSSDDFLWLSQLRYYWEKSQVINPVGSEFSNSVITKESLKDAKVPMEFGVCVRQTNQSISFDYEYQGNNGRLVVTPLTDRCILTLVTALALYRGGAPSGPAGTGKTETVKDLGKNLAKFVVVFNCSDSMDYKSVGKMFSGLVQTGGWGCFDEFNRIQIEVLSVISQQVLSITNAIREKSKKFNFMGIDIKCKWSCGIFITMNPGYAGRTELPDNLKSLFRPVSMMVPDLALITEVMLASEGFDSAKGLAKKTTTLYSLMIQQLSKQDHYDFGLRSLRGVLMAAGSLKRTSDNIREDLILLQALRDMNVPKLVKDDKRLFLLLINDLFPGQETPESSQFDLKNALEQQMSSQKLTPSEFIVKKAVQLYESGLTRHCNMLVGKSLAGKTTIWQTLEGALNTLATSNKSFKKIEKYCLNPKSLTMNELYGAFDLTTFEWTDGVLSNIFRNCSNNESPNVEQWLLLDGPVDTLWIESMNTVMDDNKTLTLINGDRISMHGNMRLLFEVLDLSVASPATVSRAGMIFVDSTELTYKEYFLSWIKQRKLTNDTLSNFLTKHVVAVLGEFSSFELLSAMRICQTFLHLTISFCNVLDALLKVVKTKLVKEVEETKALSVVGMATVFALVWSLGGSLEEKERKQFEEKLRNIGSLSPYLPKEGSCYDCFPDWNSYSWKLFSSKLKKNWTSQKGVDFNDIIVPTTDFMLQLFLISGLLLTGFYPLVVGPTGSGKTLISLRILSNLVESSNEEKPEDLFTCSSVDQAFIKLLVYFTATTTSTATQDIFEGSLEKKNKSTFGPPTGKKLICFVDDLNMPKKDLFGSQPPLELLRQLVEYNGWYERTKQTWRNISDVQLFAAMGYPGGGRAEISERFLSKFNVLSFVIPNNTNLGAIYSGLIQPNFEFFESDVKATLPKIINCSIAVFKEVAKVFLATPAHSHYIFNTRDVGKVMLGLLQADPNSVQNAADITTLWTHEVFRVFSDRLINEADIVKFGKVIKQLSNTYIGFDALEALREELETPLLKQICDKLVFSCINTLDTDAKYLQELGADQLKERLEGKLEDYNNEPGLLTMSLVLFNAAIYNICKVFRVLKLSRGSCLLLGLGGSGRQSTTLLAAYVAEQETFRIDISKSYKVSDFNEDMKSLLLKVGTENKEVTFLFTDQQVINDSFLESINCLLSSGEIPNLFTREEKLQIYEEVRSTANPNKPQTSETLWEHFVAQVRKNLHIVLTFSPIGDTFRNYCRMYPSLINCTTIIYFHSWPPEALKEVAKNKLNKGKILRSEEQVDKLAECFASVHQYVCDKAIEMRMKLNRYNYITPSNFLSLTSVFVTLMCKRITVIDDKIRKLSGGLHKLAEGKEQVEAMSVVLEKKQLTVKASQKECEELLVVIIDEKRIADEQKKQVEAHAQRIGLDEVECQRIAEDAENDLAAALPLLENAMAEVDKLDKSSISEVKAYASPPAAVEMVLYAVMLLFELKPNWPTAKKKISEPNFLSQIKSFDKDKVPNKVLVKLSKYTKRADFTPEVIKSKSLAAAALCVWVRAIEFYCGVFREVLPKKQLLKAAQKKLAAAQASLQKAREELDVVTEKLCSLNNKYEESVNTKNALRDEAETLQNKLEKAEKLVNGLAGERSRWEESITQLNGTKEFLPGDSLLAAGFLSYAGPFDTNFRLEFISTWKEYLSSLSVPFSSDFSLSDFLVEPTQIRSWTLAGLPEDSFSIENGVTAIEAIQYPLLIDPQGQGNKWLRNFFKNDGINVKKPVANDLLRSLQSAIQYGTPFLLEDVTENVPKFLDPVLSQDIVVKGSRKAIRIGDKEVDFNDNFSLFLTTKLANPHYKPELLIKVTLINFCVKFEGLESQLLSEVIKSEKPSLEKQKAQLVVETAEGKAKIQELEDSILKSLATAEGSLLEDDDLVENLQISKQTAEMVIAQLSISEKTQVQIDAIRQGYRPVSQRAAVLFFVVYDLSYIDPMYQFSLANYVKLFRNSIKKSRVHGSADQENLEDRISGLNEFHTYAVYGFICQGLFERHKLLLSLHICFSILKHANQLDSIEERHLLLGATVIGTVESNPARSFLSDSQWCSVLQLQEQFKCFKGLVDNIVEQMNQWKAWVLSKEPENEKLPQEWEKSLKTFQKAILVRALRIDRSIYSLSNFVKKTLGERFIVPPSFDLKNIFNNNSPETPLLFILSPGVDPTKIVFVLGQELGHIVTDCSLGQGQSPLAESLIQAGLKEGNWVFLANCHLAGSWLSELEKIIEKYSEDRKFHKDYRLWLSSSPDKTFPLNIIQNSMKITMEPPKGLRANLIRLYNMIPEQQFSSTASSEYGFKYKRLLYCLAWFHSVLLERRKFLSLGWNIPYDFNDADFLICENIVRMYTSQFPENIPWDAIRYLIAEANYGGRITDDRDRRLCTTYVEHLFQEAVVRSQNFNLCSLPGYVIPDDGSLQQYLKAINKLPLVDDPECFGQHSNADVSSLRTNGLLTLGLLSNLRLTGSGKSDSKDQNDLFTKSLSKLKTLAQRITDIDELKTMFNKRPDPDTMNNVLFQEKERYNLLLVFIDKTVAELEKGTQGLTVLTSELEETMESLLNGQVPKIWQFCFPSLKPLGSWMVDLEARLDFFDSWQNERLPTVFWLGGFTYPTGFLTSLLQTTARKYGISVDALTWDFKEIESSTKYKEADEIETQNPVSIENGALISGLYIEGGSWDFQNSCLADAEPLEIVAKMPVIYFKPVEISKKPKHENKYVCPCYLYPIRTGTRERPSYMLDVELQCGTEPASYWILRGCALLLSIYE